MNLFGASVCVCVCVCVIPQWIKYTGEKKNEKLQHPSQAQILNEAVWISVPRNALRKGMNLIHVPLTEG